MKRIPIAIILVLTVTLFSSAQQTGAGIVNLLASSNMPSYFTYHYGPENAFDGEPLTAWVEGVEGDGIGEYLGMTLDREITVDAIGVMPGYFDPPYFYTNNRVKSLRIETDQDLFTLELEDVMEEDMHYLPWNIRFSRIWIEITDVHPGKDPDTCIAEITFYSNGQKIPLRIGRTGSATRLDGTKYYRVDVFDDFLTDKEGAFRKEHIVMEYDVPEIIIYREAFDFNLLTGISDYEYEMEKDGDCEKECLFIKVEPNAAGLIGSITTSFDHRASTGVITNTFTFDSEGLLTAMSIDGFAASYAPVEIYHSDIKGGRRLEIVTQMEYWQGGAGEAVTARKTIDYNDEYEITYYYPEYESEYLYYEPPEEGVY